MHFLAYAATIEQVEPALFPMLADWRRECTMEDVLVQLKKEMSSTQNRKLVQPPDGYFSFDSFDFLFYRKSSNDLYNCSTAKFTFFILSKCLHY